MFPSAQLRGEQPSYLKGDNFFKFTCCDCSEDGKESFERMRLTWQQVRPHLCPHQPAETPTDLTGVSHVTGGDAGHVQPVSGGNGPPGLLQVEGGHLRFHWPTLELPAGNQVKCSDAPHCVSF